jgi:hypothetical protein
MATDFSNHLITKATVILDQPSDWRNWIFLCKDSAQRSNLWAYVNPNVTSEAVFKLEAEKPAKKEAGVFYGREQENNTVYNLEHLDVRSQAKDS